MSRTKRHFHSFSNHTKRKRPIPNREFASPNRGAGTCHDELLPGPGRGGIHHTGRTSLAACVNALIDLRGQFARE